MCKAETRRWLWDRSLEEWWDDDLTDWQIDWIMSIENFQTTLLWWKPHGGNTPSTGGSWFIRTGNCLVLAELLWWTYDAMTCHQIYKMWISLPVLAYKRRHGQSQSENATRTRNAKMLQYSETGRWGLNARGRHR